MSTGLALEFLEWGKGYLNSSLVATGKDEACVVRLTELSLQISIGTLPIEDAKAAFQQHVGTMRLVVVKGGKV